MTAADRSAAVERHTIEAEDGEVSGLERSLS